MGAFLRTSVLFGSLASLLLPGIPAAGAQTLAGFASLPADTFEPDGHSSGQFLGDQPINGRTPPFHTQPITGISALVHGEEAGVFLALADNGYGTKAASRDFLLSVYRVRPDFRAEQEGEVVGSGKVEVELAFGLSDPDGHIPWPIVADGETYPDCDIPVPPEVRQRRLLTGGDLDPQSMVRLPDGTFWIGDNYGPFLLHFDAEGRLLEPPVELPGEGMHSPDHPTKDPGEARVQRGGGFGGMYVAEGAWLETGEELFIMPFLAKPIDGEQSLREYRFHRVDLSQDKREHLPAELKEANEMFVLQSDYQLTADDVAVGGVGSLQRFDSPILLLLERDSAQGAEAQVKRIIAAEFLHHEQRPDGTSFRGWKRRAVINLLNLPDPHDLDGDGGRTFRFPFREPAALLVIDERTVLVANDNNYPFASGRTPGQPDPTEFILIRFDKPLAELGSE